MVWRAGGSHSWRLPSSQTSISASQKYPTAGNTPRPALRLEHKQRQLGREELLRLAAGPTVQLALQHLETKLSNLGGVKRREASGLFNPSGHLEKGLGIFSNPDYVRSYNMVDGDFE